MSQRLPETAVPAGYKQTEVGVIPEDWEVVELYKIYAFKQGLQCSIENQYENYFKSSIRFIRIIDLTNKNEPPRYINDPGKSYHVDESDLFMVRYGSPGLLGIGYKGIIANNLFKLSPKIKLNNKFYYFY